MAVVQAEVTTRAGDGGRDLLEEEGGYGHHYRAATRQSGRTVKAVGGGYRRLEMRLGWGWSRGMPLGQSQGQGVIPPPPLSSDTLDGG